MPYPLPCQLQSVVVFMQGLGLIRPNACHLLGHSKSKPEERGWNAQRIARAWSVLMQRVGYKRYVAQGGGWGAFVTTAMAQQGSSGLAAIHLNFAQTIPDEIPAKLQPDQQRVVDALRQFKEKGSAYLQMQSARPQTIGDALMDSPVGQAAWNRQRELEQ